MYDLSCVYHKEFFDHVIRKILFTLAFRTVSIDYFNASKEAGQRIE